MMGGDRRIRSFEDIVGWQKARGLVKVICQMTNELEKFRMKQITQNLKPDPQITQIDADSSIVVPALSN